MLSGLFASVIRKGEVALANLGVVSSPLRVAFGGSLSDEPPGWSGWGRRGLGWDAWRCAPLTPVLSAVCAQVAAPWIAPQEARLGLRLGRTRRDSFPNLRKCLPPDTQPR